MKPVKVLGTQHLAGSDPGVCHCSVVTMQIYLIVGQSYFGGNQHKEQDGKWNEFRSFLFLWVCFLSAQFHVGTFNHYSPWCEMNEIYSLDISNQYAFQFRNDDWTYYPSS